MSDDYGSLYDELQRIEQEINQIEDSKSEELTELKKQREHIRADLKRRFAEEVSYDVNQLESNLRSTLNDANNLLSSKSSDQDNPYNLIVSIRFTRRRIKRKDEVPDSVSDLLEESRNVESSLWNQVY